MSDETTAATRAILDRFYAAYTDGNLDGMLALLADDAIVTFTGHGTFRGNTEIRPYMTWAATQLPELDFRVTARIVDGDRAAVTWDETGRTARGETWTAIGVDVYRISVGQIVELTDYTDTDKLRRLLDPYPGSVP
jgi:uncharacterized protein (TIGR02246 family)